MNLVCCYLQASWSSIFCRFYLFVFFFSLGSAVCCYVVEAGFKFFIPLPQPPDCLEFRCVPPCQASVESKTHIERSRSMGCLPYTTLLSILGIDFAVYLRLHIPTLSLSSSSLSTWTSPWVLCTGEDMSDSCFSNGGLVATEMILVDVWRSVGLSVWGE